LAGFIAPDWKMAGYQALVAVGSGIVTAFIISGALPIFESLFGITTEISWLEMADLNHPLLKRMMLEAPGTYQHSLVVATLAEAACETIGANATMARVCSYFHDIGKLHKPEYFTENMRHGRNPHDDLAPTMSALIIIAHVKEGVDLALKHNLKLEIIDVIQQHHGTSLVYYFYKRALQQQEDARAGGKIMNIREEDIPDVREESFRYSGPRPQTRETAVNFTRRLHRERITQPRARNATEDRSTHPRYDRATPRRWATAGMRPDAARDRNGGGELPQYAPEHDAQPHRIP
jgi:putative nucleotidyltransferase with HDIG domain